MGRKDIECLVGKICSMHLVVPGSVAHMFHIQRAMTQKVVDQAWLLPSFHREIADWRELTVQVVARPTHLAKIVYRKPTHLGFCNMSGLGVGGGVGSIHLDRVKI